MILSTVVPDRIVTEDAVVQGEVITRSYPRWTPIPRVRKLRKRRLVCGIDQRELAHALGISVGAYSAIEQGAVTVSPEDWGRIVEAFKGLARAKFGKVAP